MEPQRWQQLKALFEAALSLPEEERSPFLEAECVDEDLRQEALSLLAFHEQDEDFLEAPVQQNALRAIAKQQVVDWTGSQIGRYRILRELGYGGMGTVYLAERADGQFEQHVAIKLVRQRRHNDELLERLRHERQILASLQHPNIARLLDGGVTPDGLPYLVMEYVEGVPIDTYSDEHRLTTNERLDLFQPVCAAVHYAHQNLIVHRDIKPSNILVTKDGRVKLLDFGIAKLVHVDPASTIPLTRTGMRLLTPQYASPEQIRGETVTTATDVYALGVVLYELLVGRRPYEVRGLSSTQAERVICEQEPPRPSTAVTQAVSEKAAEAVAPEAISHARGTQPERLRRRLRGDLDTIVLTALRKDPTRRYGSAEQLSEDIRRHRTQLPILARPETFSYQISRFMQRHRVGMVATALVLLALLGGIVATIYQASVAAAERDRAEQRFSDVRALAKTLLFDLHDAISDLPGSTAARQLLVNEASSYLTKLSQETSDDPSLQREVAEAYQRVGEIQGDPHFPNLGDLTGATESYRQAVALREALWQLDTTDTAARHALANSYGRLAVTLSWGGDNDRAIELSREALRLLAKLEHTDVIIHDVGRIRSELGWWLIWAGQTEAGLAELAKAEPLLFALAQAHPDDLQLQIDHVRVYGYQHDGLNFSGSHRAALARMEEKALPTLLGLQKRFPDTRRVLSSLATCYGNIGARYQRLGDRERTLAAYEAQMRLAQQIVALDSTDHRGQSKLAAAHLSIGQVLAEMDSLEQALAAFQASMHIKRLQYLQDPANGEAGNGFALALNTLCKTYLDAGQPETALTYCQQSAPILASAIEHAPGNNVWRSNLMRVHTNTARAHRAHALQPVSSEENRYHVEQALDQYQMALHVFAAMPAVDTSYAWGMHPDTILAERNVLLASSR